MKRKYFLAAVPVVALVVAFGYFHGGGQAPAGQPPLQSLTQQDVSGIKDAFNRSQDDVRVMLLLSPT